jgi:SAM-dependent methyltransferase
MVIDAVRRFVGAGAVCMEIGCGRGHFVTALRGRGFEAYGVELGEPVILGDAVPFVRAGTSFADLPESNRNQVTCVLLLDVIEHIADAQQFLRQVAASFPNLELLVVTVPARPEIWSNYDDYYGHFRRYTIQDLRATVDGAGFRVVKMRYAFRMLYLAALFLRLLGSKRSVVQATPKFPLVHKAIALALRIETSVLPNNLIGSSLLCVATPER